MAIAFSDLRHYMQMCIDLARSTEPGIHGYLVGCLILDPKGTVIGKGYKSFVPGTSEYVMHAERAAINSVENPSYLKGSMLITTLEPCARLPKRIALKNPNHEIFLPCTELIAEVGISQVIIGLREKGVKRGAGINYLRNRNVGVLEYEGFEKEIKSLFRPFPVPVMRELS